MAPKKEELFRSDLLYKDIGYKYINHIIVAKLNKDFNLPALFESIVVNCEHDMDIITKSKKMPYLGKEESFLSANLNGKHKGYRKCNKPLKNLIPIDYQIFGCNRHIKICKGKIHLTGSKSKEEGMKILNNLLSNINKYQKLINDIKYKITNDEELNSDEKEYMEKNVDLMDIYENVDEAIKIEEFDIKTIFYFFQMPKKINIEKCINLMGDEPYIINFYNGFTVKEIIYTKKVGDKCVNFKIFGAGSINTSSSLPELELFKIVNEIYDKISICFE